jgi:hypothetical protein
MGPGAAIVLGREPTDPCANPPGFWAFVNQEVGPPSLVQATRLHEDES